MKLDALQASQVSNTQTTPAALSISRTTLSTVRTGLRAGTRPYIGIRVTYLG